MDEFDGIDLEPERWPKSLRQLLPAVRQWGASDDAQRGAEIARASDLELRDFVELVEPHFGLINAYLDETNTDENAAPLGALAEAAAEARLELERRTQPPEAGMTRCTDCNGDGFTRAPHPTVRDGWVPNLCMTCEGQGKVPAS
jgi:hypothetical protein